MGCSSTGRSRPSARRSSQTATISMRWFSVACACFRLNSTLGNSYFLLSNVRGVECQAPDSEERMEWTRDSVTLARFPRHPTNGWTVRLRPSTSSDAVSVSLALPFLRIPGVLMRGPRCCRYRHAERLPQRRLTGLAIGQEPISGPSSCQLTNRAQGRPPGTMAHCQVTPQGSGARLRD
jgi:hypothetical protein